MKTSDLHGNAPDKSSVALILIDVINDLEFPEGDQMVPQAVEVAKRLKNFKRRAKAAGIPAIYVNDNFGRWQSNFQKQVEHCLHENTRGKPIVELLRPEKEDYFVLKPKHSGFFSTTLETLVRYLGAETLVLTGIAGNICVLYTANDAYMRDFTLFVPRDCTVSNTEKENEYALDQMQRFLKADTRPSTEIDVDKLVQR